MHIGMMARGVRNFSLQVEDVEERKKKVEEEEEEEGGKRKGVGE